MLRALRAGQIARGSLAFGVAQMARGGTLAFGVALNMS